jgi:hypothetical protein
MVKATMWSTQQRRGSNFVGLRPFVPINTTQAVRDRALDGIHVPAGTLVICLSSSARASKILGRSRS